jgi:hypothetical protein
MAANSTRNMYSKKYIEEWSIHRNAVGLSIELTPVQSTVVPITVLGCLSRGSADTRLLGLRVRISPRAWISVSCDLSGRGLCDELITSPDRRVLQMVECLQWRTAGGFGGFKPTNPRNSEVLTKLSRIPSTVDNTSVTTQSEYEFHSFENRVEPLTRGLPPPDPSSLRPLSSTEFVEPSPPKNFWFNDTPLPKNSPGYATVCLNVIVKPR